MDCQLEFRRGAQLALEAGFDGVEVHGANGYLPDQFLNSSSNHRTDEWGGSLENRARFLLEVTDAVISVWGPGRVGVRLSPTNQHGDIEDANRLETYSYAVEQVNKRHPACIHLVSPRVSGNLDVQPALDLGPDRFRRLITGETRLIAAGGYKPADASSSPAPAITSISATTGAVGNQIVIAGTGFGSAQCGSLVVLNGSPITVNSWSATSIAATIPTGEANQLPYGCGRSKHEQLERGLVYRDTSNLDQYEKQLNVYAHIWQSLRNQPLDETAVIATAFPDTLSEALQRGNPDIIAREMEAWEPLVRVPLNQSRVEATIEDFGKVVDQIEGKPLHRLQSRNSRKKFRE